MTEAPGTELVEGSEITPRSEPLGDCAGMETTQNAMMHKYFNVEFIRGSELVFFVWGPISIDGGFGGFPALRLDRRFVADAGTSRKLLDFGDRSCARTLL